MFPIFFCFLIIYLYFLIPVVITEFYIAIVKLAVPSKIPTKEEIAKIETHSATADAEISKCLAQFKILQIILCFLVISSICFISSRK